MKDPVYNEFNTDIQKRYKDAFTGCMREGMPNAENENVPVYLGFWMDRTQLSVYPRKLRPQFVWDVRTICNNQL